MELALRDTADKFGQSLATSATIIVTVEDLPDLDPIWVQPCYPQAIDEEIPLGLVKILLPKIIKIQGHF